MPRSPRSSPRARSFLTAVAVALAGLSFPGPAAAQEPGTATLLASTERLTAGDTLVLTGSLDAADECSQGRSVELQRLTAGGSSWEPEGVDQLTGEDGAFEFSIQPDHSASFRAVAPATGACGEVASPEASVKVVALVANSLARPRLGAGGCVRMTVTVSPDKTGHIVRIQRRRPAGWRAIATVELGEGSTAVATPCFAWKDMGTVRLRAKWPAQDPLNEAAAGAPVDLSVVKAKWMRRIDRLTAGLSVSVSVREAGDFLYRRRDADWRIPASNQKLLVSMAILDALGPGFRFETRVVGPAVEGGVVRGDLWILGRGDPTTGRRQIRRLARQIVDAGVRRVRGSVMGSKSFFRREWWAPGWRWYFPRYYVARPTALTYQGNRSKRGHVRDPERRAAAVLTRRLETLGVGVSGDPGAGRPAKGLGELAKVRSAPLGGIVRAMNLWSSNFYAEVLGKRLGVAAGGPPGSIASGASASRAWAGDHGASVAAYDASGLSYWNRLTAAGLAKLLGAAETRSWGTSLRLSLPAGGQGTLRGRLGGVPVRAKTGTLRGVSALSGYVWLEKRGTWAEFSILTGGASKSTAVRVEDAVVRIVSEKAR